MIQIEKEIIAHNLAIKFVKSQMYAVDTMVIPSEIVRVYKALYEKFLKEL